MLALRVKGHSPIEPSFSPCLQQDPEESQDPQECQGAPLTAILVQPLVGRGRGRVVVLYALRPTPTILNFNRKWHGTPAGILPHIQGPKAADLLAVERSLGEIWESVAPPLLAHSGERWDGSKTLGNRAHPVNIKNPDSMGAAATCLQ